MKIDEVIKKPIKEAVNMNPYKEARTNATTTKKKIAKSKVENLLNK